MAAETRVFQAVFEDEEGLRASLRGLVDSGFDSSHIEICSSIPLQQVQSLPGVRVRSRVPFLAVIGGFLGGLGAFLLASVTAKLYPLVTGGMPIVASPPVGIITYEGVALGAILATVAGVLLEGRLVRLGHRYSPLHQHVAEGRILLSVRCDGQTGIEKVKKIVHQPLVWNEEEE